MREALRLVDQALENLRNVKGFETEIIFLALVQGMLIERIYRSVERVFEEVPADVA